MKVPHNSHVALVDGQRFLVLRNDGKLFQPSLSLVAEPDLEATNFSGGASHRREQDAGGRRGRAGELDELAHAAAAAAWLNQQVLAGAIERLTVIADPKTLGEMRRHYHKQVSAILVSELARDIAAEPIAEIERALERD